MAFDMWGAQQECDAAKNSDCVSDHKKIVDPKNLFYGAAWSDTNTIPKKGEPYQLPCGPLVPGGSAGVTYFYVVLSDKARLL